jgi:dTDP-4-amino-4,6-dideoxygalactose transaminase
MIAWWSNNFGEVCARAAYNEILNKNISQGLVTKKLEDLVAKEFEVPYVIAMNSGSSALYSILFNLDLKPDDEVLVQSRTWVATLNSSLLANLNVRLIDISSSTYCMDVDLLKKSINTKTKAVVITHMNGRGNSMDEIVALCKKHNIYLIEDAAQSIYSKHNDKYLGTYGDASIFSLSTAKIISSGQGGLALIKDEDLASKVRNFRTQGVESTHEPNIWENIGGNFRYTDVLASIALVQFSQAKERLDACNQIYKKYNDFFSRQSKLKFLTKNAESEVQTYIEVMCENRENLKNFLFKKGVDTREFYPAMSKAHYLAGDKLCPVAENLSRMGLYLPSGPGQNLADIDRVLDILSGY